MVIQELEMPVEGKGIRMRITTKHLLLLVANIRSFIGFWIDMTRCETAIF